MRYVRSVLALTAALATASCLDTTELQPCNPIQIVDATDIVTGSVALDECAQPFGILGDVYALTLPSASQLLITMDADGFEGELLFYKGSFAAPGSARAVFAVDGTGLIGSKAFVPAGSYFIVARGVGTAVGAYTMELAPTTLGLCDDTFPSFTIRGADIPGVVVDADCAHSEEDSRQEAFQIWMTPLEMITVTIDMDKPGALLWRRTGDDAAPNLSSVAVEAGVRQAGFFVAPDANVPFSIHVVSSPPVTGAAAYTLRIR